MIYLCKIVDMPILKIGFSLKPKLRYEILENSMPFRIEVLAERNGSKPLEFAIHKSCKDFLIKNEWYIDCDFVKNKFFSEYDPEPKAKSMADFRIIKEIEEKQRRLYFMPTNPMNSWGPRKFLKIRGLA